MTCRELIEFLMDYLDGTLPPEQRREFERHLAVCPSCVAYLKSYEQTSRLAVEALTDSAGPAILPPVPEGLVRAVLAAAAAKSS